MGRDAVADALRAQILGALHVGRLVGGARLPSARDLAKEYGVNERVVLAAVRTLSDEGFLDLRARSGAYLKPPHPAGDGGLPDIGAWVVGMLIQARARGLAPRGIANYLKRTLETRRIRAACIECNLDQLHMLCSELSADYGFEAESTELSKIHESDAVKRADVLITTLFHAAEVEQLAKQLSKPCVCVTLRADVMRSIGQTLRAGPLYYVATDPRFEMKLRAMLKTLGPIDNLRYVLIGRDDPDQIPPDAATYIMSSAREHLAAHYAAGGGPGHPIHPPRIFSDQSARELLTMVVRANSAALAAGLS
ncbi:MAG: GntR family transcriptional regulator [Gemmatimonadaceae bacterium]